MWTLDRGRPVKWETSAKWETSYQLLLLSVPSEKRWELEPGQGQCRQRWGGHFDCLSDRWLLGVGGEGKWRKWEDGWWRKGSRGGMRPQIFRAGRHHRDYPQLTEYLQFHPYRWCSGSSLNTSSDRAPVRAQDSLLHPQVALWESSLGRTKIIN